MICSAFAFARSLLSIERDNRRASLVVSFVVRVLKSPAVAKGAAVVTVTKEKESAARARKLDGTVIVIWYRIKDWKALNGRCIKLAGSENENTRIRATLYLQEWLENTMWKSEKQGDFPSRTV